MWLQKEIKENNQMQQNISKKNTKQLFVKSLNTQSYLI